MEDRIKFYETLIIADGFDTARRGGSFADCPYFDARNSHLWIEAFKAYHDGQAAKIQPVKLAA
jgi:hypothetical protein